VVIWQLILKVAEEIDFANRRISNFKGLVTLTLDRVIRHTVVHHSSTSTHIPNFIGIGKTFCGRTYGRTDMRPMLLGRLFRVDLKKLTFVQLQNSFFKFKFPSFRRMSSKYNTKQQTRWQLCVEQISKIWCKNIHAFLRNPGFRVGAFYFDASCIAQRQFC